MEAKRINSSAVNANILADIARVIREEAEKLGVKVVKIILFGSRARGDHRGDSDWDVLVVVGEDVPRKVRAELAERAMWRLAWELEAPADVIVVTRSRWERYSRHPGTVLYPARREGVTIA